MKMHYTATIFSQKTLKSVLFASIAGLMFSSMAVQADDVEIYLTPPPNPVPPNVLFILDESGSMGNGTSTGTRISDLRNAMTNILNDPANDNINAGIMAYTTHDGNNGPLSLRAVSDFGIIGDNVIPDRTTMIPAVSGLTARSFTPSVKALEAGVEWFRNGFTDSQYNWTVMHGGTTPQTYPSPIGNNPAGHWCRPNHMVFLTDGIPNSNNPPPGGNYYSHVGAYIPNYGVTAYPAPGTTAPDVACAADPFFGAGRCSGEIAEWASTTDLKTGGAWDYDPAATGGSIRIQNIVTQTIGFGISAGSTAEGYLQNIASKGTGTYYPAANATDLKNAFGQILSNATTSIPYTYNSPTIPYSPDNAAISDNFLYVPMFSPLVKRYWKGNLKKYRVGLDANGDVFFKDRNGADAVNSNFLFNTNTQDYWSSAANTGETYKGGAMSNMSSTTPRRLYTWLPGNNVDLTVTSLDPISGVTISPNRVHEDNSVITSGLLGTGSASVRSTVLDWANWIGDKPPPVTIPPTTNTSNDDFPQTTPPASNGDGLREYMGASLHTKPEVARYTPKLDFIPDDGAGGGDVDAVQNTISFSQAHIWSTGDSVVYSSGAGSSLPIQGGGALSDGAKYYIVNYGSTSVQLAATAADAAAGTVIDLANATGNTSVNSLTTGVAIDIVLITTSEGVLHAFNGGTDTVAAAAGDGGGEIWSFMPRQLLSRISSLRDNVPADTPYYGLDGPMTIYDSGSRKYVAVTMRRGGRNIYVLDITDLNKPKMAWEILGGSTTDFIRLGQTWSEPQFLRMEINGAAAKDVLVFGGGYDNTTQDPNSSGVIPASRIDDTMGNAIYVVDAVTGARLAYFSADTTTNVAQSTLQVSGMENSIIGVLPADINNNGITDRLYASGVGGRIFRIDIPDSGFASTVISGGLIADVNAGSSVFRRFFNEPEVAFYSRGGNQFLGILIGSGYRPSPLNNTVTDRFYMIKDDDVFTVPGSYTSIDEGDLYDASANLIQDGTAAEQATAAATLITKNGWYIDLLDGSFKQKVFSKARVFNSVILFTTYQGERSLSTDICEALTTKGLSNVYAIGLLDASAVADLNPPPPGGGGSGVGSFNKADRLVALNTPGLPPPPVILFPPDTGSGGSGSQVKLGKTGATVIVGLEGVIKFPDRFFPVTWEEIIQ